jgi:hypothetical protein
VQAACQSDFKTIRESRILSATAILIHNPDAGALIPGAGGLRKLRVADVERNQGKRDGMRMIYFWWQEGKQFWLFTLYGKNEMSNLSAQQTSALKKMIKTELSARQKPE